MAPMTPLALALAGCTQGHVARLTPHGVMTLDSEAVAVPDTPYHTRGEGVLRVANSGDQRLGIDLSLSTDDDTFQLSQHTLSLAPAEAVDLTIWFNPVASLDPSETTLTLTPDDGEAVEVVVTGQVDPDGDDDGHEHPALGGDDCDDNRSDVSPSASETWYDDLDQDCDGASDHDADLDGWDAEPRGQDCDDADPSVSPEAEEIWYDDIDQDCDELSDHDADLDGADLAPTGDDCDDTDPLINPGADEVWYDGIDQDCDGASDGDADLDGQDSSAFGGEDCDDDDPDTWLGAPEDDDLEDDDCDGLVDEDHLSTGDVVITEVLVEPEASYAHYGQFVEVLNVSSRQLALQGWALTSDAGGDLGLVSEEVLAPGGRALFCLSEDLVVNGGLACQGLVDGPTLTTVDGLTLSAGALDLDGVSWTPLWPLTPGASLSLSPEAEDHEANDERTQWCAATTEMGSGDLGTPGSANDACP